MRNGGKVRGWVTAIERNGYVVVQERIPAPPPFTAASSRPRDLAEPHPDVTISATDCLSKSGQLVQRSTLTNHHIYRAYVRIIDRICVGDSVLISSGSSAARRGIVKSISDGGQLLLRPMTSELDTVSFYTVYHRKNIYMNTRPFSMHSA